LLLVDPAQLGRLDERTANAEGAAAEARQNVDAAKSPPSRKA
jgi:hypothetical protein